MSAIEVRDLRFGVRKSFWERRRDILGGVSLAVERGEIFGFLGPNGAGKTTTIKAILNLLRPDSGTIKVLGSPPSDVRGRERLGYMPEQAYFPDHLSARELLLSHAFLAGLSRRQAWQQAEALIDRVGLSKWAREPLRTYSKGMLQRAGLAQALVADPELVILDEPMSGLDPIGRRDMREIILGLRAQGKTVFFSTHILPDAEMIADRVGIIAAGATRTEGKLSDLLGQSIERVEVSCEQSERALRCEAAKAAVRCETRGSDVVLVADSIESANRIIDALRKDGVQVRGLQVHRRSLEQIFVQEAARAGATEAT